MKKFIIGLTIFVLGAFSGWIYYSFIESQNAFVMVVDIEQCNIHKVKIEIDNKDIYVEKTTEYKNFDIMVYSGPYPYHYRLTTFTKECGEITSEIRKVTRGHVFYERVYKDKIEHEIRA